MGVLSSLINTQKNQSDFGKQSPIERNYIATPWHARTNDGLWIGVDGSVTLYRKIPEYAYAWETLEVQLSKGGSLHQMLEEIGRMSKTPSVGEFASLAKNRKVHLVSHLRYVRPPYPEGCSPEHKAFLDELFLETNIVVPQQFTAIGVTLWPSVPTGKRRQKKNVIEQVRDYASQYSTARLPDLSLYEQDRELITSALSHYSVEVLSLEDRLYMERWISGGSTDEPVLVEEDDRIIVRDRNPENYDNWERLNRLAGECEKEGNKERARELYLEADSEILFGGNVIQFLAASESGMPREIGNAPSAPWLMDAQQHSNAAICTSLRFELEPGSITRNRARKSQKHAYKQLKEEAESSEILSRVEQEDAFSGAKSIEDHYASTSEPSITKMSILWAWEYADVDENFADFIRARYEIDAQVLAKRQYDAAQETLPASPIMAAPDRPYTHDALIQTLAHSGLGSMSLIGDSIETSKDPTVALPVAVHTGIAHPSGSVVWTNPWAASETNSPPTMVVIGQPGSGKTYLIQHLCYQFALNNIPVFFVNPKGEDSLEDYATFCGGETIKISDVASTPGAFDPFRFAKGRDVVEIATDHITSSLNNRGSGLSMDEVIAVSSAMEAAVKGGQVQTVGQSMYYLPEQYKYLAERVWSWARNNANFGLGVGFEPRESLGAGRRFTLVEFDQGAALPERTNPNELTMGENSSIAGQRLLWRAGIEIMKQAGGGVVAGDEAWTFLSSPHAASIIAGLNRKGRSMGIFLALMTQKIADIEMGDLEGYLSRVAIMAMDDRREIEAALRLCRMEMREDLVDIIRTARPAPPTAGDPERGVPGNPARPAQMIFRDMDGHHGVVTVEPVVERYRRAFSTNRKDKQARARGGPVIPGVSEPGQPDYRA